MSSGDDNRMFCEEDNIDTLFILNGCTRNGKVRNTISGEPAIMKATAMEWSFSTQKKHYGIRKISRIRIKLAEIQLSFFGSILQLWSIWQD